MIRKHSIKQMLAWDVVQTALATICIMVIIQVVIFFVARVMTPPEPKIIYREIPVPVQAPTVTFTEPPVTEVKLPEYEPRQQASDSLRLDAQLPPGITETRPPGT
jgi:hypothetical protein